MKALLASSREARAAGLFAATAGLLIARARRSRALSTRADVPPAPPAFRARVLSLREQNYGAPAGEEEARLLSSARLVVFGELHQLPPCIEMERRTAEGMLSSSGCLHILLEHFNFEQQPLLDAYAMGRIDMAGLAAAYEEGGEGHDVAAYEPLLRLAREQPAPIHIHAGFIPRSYARIVMRESTAAALEAARAHDYVGADERCDASEAHYNFFESLLTGRSPHGSAPPTDQFRKMFPAQVIKDAAMAHRVATLAASRPADKFLVICGIGHSGYGHGVPERILAARPELASSMLRVWSLPADAAVDLDDGAAVAAVLRENFGPPGASDPAELCLCFQEVAPPPPSTTAAASPEAVKASTAAAYDKVGETAALRGNARRALAVLRRMRYSEAEIVAAGDDAANFQGVGCPHRHARLAPGEHVLDLGSGLGVDSFIAAAATGERGRVTGIDIAAKEVRHASERAHARGLGDRVTFEVADLEKLPQPSESYDAVISNGAFCLAPDKPAAFREAHRVLKAGGRMAIALSVLKGDGLAPGVNWPLCMQTFVPLKDLRPTAEAAGFTDVEIDTSDS